MSKKKNLKLKTPKNVLQNKRNQKINRYYYSTLKYVLKLFKQQIEENLKQNLILNKLKIAFKIYNILKALNSILDKCAKKHLIHARNIMKIMQKYNLKLKFIIY